MKLCRYGPSGEEKPGLVDENGRIRDLSGHVDDITPDALSPRMLANLSKVDVESLPLVDKDVRYGVPVNGIPKIVAVGLNYADHARESGLPPRADHLHEGRIEPYRPE